ncbi:MAG: hypothetical protein J0L92_30360 [Deltaproteobacteria bacterium]|nr:hypothetical protein [Deltaproteobacteria bacterium]
MRWRIGALTVGLSLATACEGSLTQSVAPGDDAHVVREDAGPAPDPGPVTYELGPTPEGLVLSWPAPPTITRDVRVTSASELSAAITSGTRVTLAVSVPRLEILVSDVELIVEDGVEVGVLWIGNRIGRIRVRGGHYGGIEVAIPGTYYPSEEWHAEWRTTDLLIDDVDVEASDSAFMLRGGVRMAVTNSRAHAVRYGVWLGDTADFGSEDIIVAGNHLVVDGPEATVRLVHVERSAVVGNRLENGAKHNYRTHGRSRENWAARNLMIGTGMMLGTLPTDTWSIERQWVEGNTLHHSVPSLLELDARLVELEMRNNTVYTDVWDCFVCVAAQPTWLIEGNVREPYRAPPSE